VCAHVNFAEVACDIHDILLQESVEANHVGLLAEEDIVCEILNDLRDYHKTPSDDGTLLIFG
jgi:hypothetical protein